jgi:hypothetical protein
MEEKANNKKKKLLTIVIVFTVVLAVTATTWCPEKPITPKSPSPPATPRPPDPPKPITCTEDTGHFKTGCKLLLHYDADNDGKISDDEYNQAWLDVNFADKITGREYAFVERAWWSKGPINELCPGCYSPP